MDDIAALTLPKGWEKLVGCTRANNEIMGGGVVRVWFFLVCVSVWCIHFL